MKGKKLSPVGLRETCKTIARFTKNCMGTFGN